MPPPSRPPLLTIERKGLRALIAPPAGAERAPPLLCFLHGYDEAAPMGLRAALTRHGPLHPDAAALRERFVVLAPQLPQAGDHWQRYAESLCALVLQAQEHYGADPRRRYLTGFSYGGNGVFDLPLVQPDFWAALWAVDPPRVPGARLREPAWLSIGSAARPRTAAFIARLGSQPPDARLK